MGNTPFLLSSPDHTDAQLTPIGHFHYYDLVAGIFPVGKAGLQQPVSATTLLVFKITSTFGGSRLGDSRPGDRYQDVQDLNLLGWAFADPAGMDRPVENLANVDGMAVGLEDLADQSAGLGHAAGQRAAEPADLWCRHQN